MTGPVVWFNKHLSNSGEVFARLREERRPGEFYLLASHPNSHFRGRQDADEFVREPGGLNEADYLAFTLEFARQRGVALFWPGRKVLPIVTAADRFASSGTRLLAAAGANELAALNHKGRTYAALAGSGVRVPEHAIVNDLAGFDAAWEDLRARHERLCFKPAISVYGIGFHIIDDQGRGPIALPLAEVRRRLAARGSFRDLMLMPYLPGPERSVDALARGGRLVRCVVRRKHADGQRIEAHPELVTALQQIAERFRLDGVVNAQFRDVDGQPYLLEINPRMSGGVPFTFGTGVTLPLWAIRLARGTASPADVPEPITGQWVPQPTPLPRSA